MIDQIGSNNFPPSENSNIQYINLSMHPAANYVQMFLFLYSN